MQPEVEEASGLVVQPEVEEASGLVVQPEVEEASGLVVQPEAEEASGLVVQPEAEEASDRARLLVPFWLGLSPLLPAAAGTQYPDPRGSRQGRRRRSLLVGPTARRPQLQRWSAEWSTRSPSGAEAE